jgi:hypothetical protein
MRGLAEIVRLRTGPCREAAEAIPQIAAGEEGLDQAASTHVSECLRCQAELAAYKRILRHLHAMRHDGIVPPAGGIAAVLAALEAAAIEQQAVPTWAVRAAYVGGITVATAAAGAAGVLVWMNRRRVALAQAG